MAFSTTNVQTTKFGNLRVTYGDWSCAVADAVGTIGVEGGRVYHVDFNGNASAGPILAPGNPNWSYSVSGAVSTVTVDIGPAVTSGTFLIIHK